MEIVVEVRDILVVFLQLFHALHNTLVSVDMGHRQSIKFLGNQGMFFAVSVTGPWDHFLGVGVGPISFKETYTDAVVDEPRADWLAVEGAVFHPGEL